MKFNKWACRDKLSFRRTLIGVYNLLDRGLRFKFLAIWLWMWVLGGLDMLSIGTIAVFVAAIPDQNYLHSSSFSYLLRMVPQDVAQSKSALMTIVGLTCILIVFLRNAFKMYSDYFVTKYWADIDAYVGNIAMKRFVLSKYDVFNRYKQYDVLRYVDLRTLFGSDFVKSITNILQSVTFFIIVFASLLYAYLLMSIVVFFVIGILAYAIYKIGENRLAVVSSDYMKEHVSTGHKVSFLFNAMKEIKLSGNESSILRLFEVVFANVAHKRTMLLFTGRAATNVMDFFGTTVLLVAILSMLYIGDYSAEVTTMAGVFALTSMRVLSMANGALAELAALRGIIPFISEMLQFFNTAQNDDETDYILDEDAELLPFNRSIILKDYSYRHPGSEFCALKRINLEISKNELVGIVGLSGSGKTTLLDAISGLIQPEEGALLVDNYAPSAVDRRLWMRGIGYVPQDPYIFEGSFAQNVSMQFSKNNINKAKVTDCARLASVDFLGPDFDINFYIEESGKNLSGGQKQRVAIARSLYKETSLLIFDEPTSALDAYNDKKFHETLINMKEKTTIIIVAHKLTFGSGFDRIIWFEAGSIRMEGAPEAVLSAYENFIKGKLQANVS